MRIARAAILQSREVATCVSSGRGYPDMSVFRNAVYRRNFSPGGGVCDPFSVRRPSRLVFATGSLSDLPNLSLQVHRKNIRVVERVGIRFMV
jgi:hypothetical protein